MLLVVCLLQVVTFDAGGVSGHANHISLYKAVRYSVCKLLWAGLRKQNQGSVRFTAPGCGTWHCLEKLPQLWK